MKKKIFNLLILIIVIPGCVNDSNEQVYNNPTVISGQVKNPESVPLQNAKVSLSTIPGFNFQMTDAHGLFRIENFPAGKHKLKVELYGYEIFEADVPSATNGISTINPVLKRKSYSVPAIKPLSTGPVRINNKKLEVDFDGDGIYEIFKVKGAAFSPVPIGSKPITSEQDDRSILFLNSLNANTFRTYSGASKTFLQKSAAEGIYCIVGFWVDYNLDLSIDADRQQVKDKFALLVNDLKDSPGLLMWTLGNEQNYANGSNPYWYSLAQELAIIAYNIEGEGYHPVSINNGNIYNIGNSSLNADDPSLTYVDLWAANIYEYNFNNSLNTYRSKTQKPIVFTEFGIDALDNRTGMEYEQTQAEFDSTNWQQIISSSDVCIGGTVFEFTDEWWKDTDPNSHNNGGYSTSAHPDGYSNEEWWGLIRVTPDSNGDGMDDWQPRLVYYMFQRNWQ